MQAEGEQLLNGRFTTFWVVGRGFRDFVLLTEVREVFSSGTAFLWYMVGVRDQGKIRAFPERKALLSAPLESANSGACPLLAILDNKEKLKSG
jgi:hypothetical protein